MAMAKRSEKPKKFLTKKNRRLIYYIAIIALPVLQFCIFYLYINFNSIILAFKKYALPESGLGYVESFAGIENFKAAFKTIGDSWQKISNSLKMIACDLLISLPLALVFSFYIYKKYNFSRLFKVILFMPQLVSSIVFVMLFKYLTGPVYAEVFHESIGLSNYENQHAFGTILVYNIWISFGVNVIMFTGSMSSIDPSLVESSQLDGANVIQEFRYITLPLIWSTFTTFVVISLTGIFINQMNLFAFYSNGAGRLSNFGYFLYVESIKEVNGVDALENYAHLSALGLVLTTITLPIVLGTRKLMEKIGPSVY